MNRITFDVNNRNTIVFQQEKHDGSVLVKVVSPDGKEEPRSIIDAGQFVMLHNLYRYILDNDFQNDFINYYGKNQEEITMRKTIGTPEEYAEAYRRKLAEGETLHNLNAANHLALEMKTISMEHFLAAAEILKAEILKR